MYVVNQYLLFNDVAKAYDFTLHLFRMMYSNRLIKIKLSKEWMIIGEIRLGDG